MRIEVSDKLVGLSDKGYAARFVLISSLAFFYSFNLDSALMLAAL